MANLNKVILIGRLTRDPELKYTQNGTPVTGVDLAINRFVPGRDGGEGRQEVTFVNVTIWGKRAEAVAEHIKKGREICIDGRLQLDQWEDQATSQKRSKLKVVAEQVQFLGGGKKEPHEEAQAPPQEEGGW